MAEDARARLKEWLASGQARLVPLTFPQRELWETAPAPPADPSNNICALLDIRGPLTLDMCREALGMVIARQEALRTTILPGKERPVQLVRASGEPVATKVELPPGAAGDEAVIAALAPHFAEPFDLVAGPLHRLIIVPAGPDQCFIGLAIHHAIADGWALTTFVEDFMTGCIAVWRRSGKDMTRLQGLSDAMTPLPMTYSQWGAADRARWTAAALERSAELWRDRLAGSSLFFHAPHPVAGESLTRWVVHIPATTAEAVRKLARRLGATPFTTLSAAFRIALQRWKGPSDVVLGTPVAGRSRAAVRETIGSFSEIVPLRSRIDPVRSLDETVRQVHEEALEDFAEAMPFAELVRAVERGGSRGRHAVYDVRFAVQNHPFPDIVVPGVSSRFRNLSSGTSRFDLACEITGDSGQMEMVWLRRESVVGQSDVQTLDAVFREVLAEA